jgi:ubiquinone/menaquinone biosynthesis C-methylase UbiE
MEKTQQQILRHHGGDGDHAREMISQTYAARHDEAFWQYWQTWCHGCVAPQDVLLDLGAGTGLFVQDLSQLYPQARILGIEAAPYMLNAQVSLPEHAEIIVDDLNAPSSAMAENTVAVAMCNMVVHELMQPILMFKSVFAWLKPGGRFCVIDLIRQPLSQYLSHRYPQADLWQQDGGRETIEEVFEHFFEHNRYHAADLVYMLESVGFQLVDQSLLKNGRMVRLLAEKPRGGRC